jgi:hypothetical protein
MRAARGEEERKGVASALITADGRVWASNAERNTLRLGF